MVRQLVLRSSAALPICCRVPVTKLGRLVRDGKIRSIEEIYLFSLPVKEYQVAAARFPTRRSHLTAIADYRPPPPQAQGYAD
jgi:small subunit ribosomal protein S2e